MALALLPTLPAPTTPNEFGGDLNALVTQVNAISSAVNGGVAPSGGTSESAAVGIIAGTTRTQAGATALTKGVNRVDVSTAPAAGSLLGDGVALPASTAGLNCTIINNTANLIQVYGNGSDTVNGIAGVTGVAIPANCMEIFKAAGVGAWQYDAGVGFAGQLNTVLAVSGITATAGGQGGAVLLGADLNRISTVAAGTGVLLRPAVPGLDIFILNHGANSLAVFGSGTDTIDDNASATGVLQMVNSVVLYTCYEVGKWYTNGLATGFALTSGLETLQFSDAVSAAGTTQATATPMTGALNTVSTVAAGTGVNLPASAAGLLVTVTNAGANPLLVYPAQGASDTINGVAATSGLLQHVGSIATYFCSLAGVWRALTVTPIQAVFNTITTAGTNSNLTAGNITGGESNVDLNLASGATAGFTITLPTVASLVQSLHGVSIGQSYRLRMINRAGFTGTVTTNTGWTLTGVMTLATITARDFDVTLTSLTTATIQDVGGFAVV